jgi:phosphatidate cytidylyltransferase
MEAPRPASGLPFSAELVKRVISAVVLAPLAVGAAYLGELVWLAAASAVAILIALEWDDVTHSGRRGLVLVAMIVGIVLAALGLALDAAGGVVVAFVGIVGLAILVGWIPESWAPRTVWAVRGLAYALAFLVPVVALRSSNAYGFEALVFVFAVVWTTDVAAFFTGRAIGGPKLWPAISPKKTWAGFVGGSLGGVVAGLVVVALLGVGQGAHAIIALVLSLFTHGGDLFESWTKRHFQKKDSGDLIPGHGGAMDRVDGLIFAASAALLIGLYRAGPGDVARGLLIW